MNEMLSLLVHLDAGRHGASRLRAARRAACTSWPDSRIHHGTTDVSLRMLMR